MAAIIKNAEREKERSISRHNHSVSNRQFTAGTMGCRDEVKCESEGRDVITAFAFIIFSQGCSLVGARGVNRRGTRGHLQETKTIRLECLKGTLLVN